MMMMRSRMTARRSRVPVCRTTDHCVRLATSPKNVSYTYRVSYHHKEDGRPSIHLNRPDATRVHSSVVVVVLVVAMASTTRSRLRDTMNDPANVRARRAHLARGASRQPEYDSASWARTACSCDGRARALDAFVAPLALVNVVSVAWTMLAQTSTLSERMTEARALDGAYALTFSAMGFLLVFRLSRAAVRWWSCRAAFGAIVAGVRDFVDVTLIYGCEDGDGDDDESAAVDDAVAWACAFASASKAFLRGERVVARDETVGILSDEDRDAVMSAEHPPLFCISMCRRAVRRLFGGSTIRDASLREELHGQLAFLALQEGALERLRATKVPEIYVVHLRTFLCLYLISMPFVFVNRWGYGTIPAVACVSFALLGIEGAATECEIPFQAERHNHLRMDAYVAGCFANVSAMLECQAERARRDGKRRGETSRADAKEDESVVDV